MKRHLTVLLPVLLVLAGCGADTTPDATPAETATPAASVTPSAEPTPTPSPSASPSRKPTPTPSPKPSPKTPPDPATRKLTFECLLKTTDDRGDSTFETFTYLNLTEVWAAPVEHREICTVNPFQPTYDFEKAALEHAYGADSDSISILYELCADTGESLSQRPFSDAQIAEMEGVFMLCPTHPERAIVEAAIVEAGKTRQREEQGLEFNSGVYRVGTDIQPGHYVSESETGFDGCYWQRLDEAGGIIDNHFVQDAFRVEVTIAASDYSFSTEGCGTWRQA